MIYKFVSCFFFIGDVSYSFLLVYLELYKLIVVKIRLRGKWVNLVEVLE